MQRGTLHRDWFYRAVSEIAPNGRFHYELGIILAPAVHLGVAMVDGVW